jgi:hypothetical protein
MANQRGRPPVDPDDPSVPVHVKLPSQQYDQACQKASQEHLSLPELIRQALWKELRNPK